MRNPLLAPENTEENRAEFRRVVMEYRRTHSIAETIARFGVSRTFVCKWQKRFRVDSSDLWERSREPKLCADRYTGEEKANLQSSLLIDNQEFRKRNKLIPTILRFSQMLENRSYASIRRIANNLIGQCKRAKNHKSKKKVRTGRSNQVVDFPGGLVQVDMKCVPASSVVQSPRSDNFARMPLFNQHGNIWKA